jgi:ribosome-binding protein aMBF1 (putative translation factor)
VPARPVTSESAAHGQSQPESGSDSGGEPAQPVRALPAGLGRVIANLRRRSGFTRRQLAQRLGLEESTVDLIETGERRLTQEEFQWIAHLLGCDIDDLLEWSQTPAAPARP